MRLQQYLIDSPEGSTPCTTGGWYALTCADGLFIPVNGEREVPFIGKGVSDLSKLARFHPLWEAFLENVSHHESRLVPRLTCRYHRFAFRTCLVAKLVNTGFAHRVATRETHGI